MDQATSLSLARIVIGIAAWASPLSLRAGLLDAAPPQAPYLLRLFGARDVALGLVTLLAAPAQKPALLRVGIAVDAADAGAAVLALRSKALKPVTGTVLAGAGAAAAVAGVVAMGQQGK